jgi:toluene monooxygenase system ferredoxin subunit
LKISRTLSLLLAATVRNAMECDLRKRTVTSFLVPVADLGELPRGSKLGRRVAGARILLVNAESGIRAYEDRCGHRDVSLCDGTLEGRVLTCKAHEWRYDADTGCGIERPGVRLRSYPVRIEGARILVDIGGGR